MNTRFLLSRGLTAAIKFTAALIIVALTLPMLPAMPAGAIGTQVILTTTGPGLTWTVPAGVTNISIECWGAGGGGGNRSTLNGRGNGGGGGAYAKVLSYAVTPGQIIPYTIGAGGGSAANGGDTTFNTNICVADGGSAGVSNGAGGGQGGLDSNSVGDITASGGSGAYNGGGGSAGVTALGLVSATAIAGNNGVNCTGGAAVANGGAGGTGNCLNQSVNGGAGFFPGGGGAGASKGGGGPAILYGGAGSNGRIIITYLPIITTPTATGIGTTSATLGADFVSANGATTVSARGICWGTTPAPTTNCTSSGTATGVYTQLVSGFTEGTLYYYRGYVTVESGTGYSEDGTFTTLSSTYDLDVSGAYNYTTAQPAIAISAGLTATSNPAGQNIDGATVIIGTNFNPGDTLAVAGYTSPWNGISWSYNATSGVLSFTGNSSITNYQTLLQAVTFYSITAVSAVRTVTFTLGAALPYSGTGYYYEYIPSSNIPWTAADTAASGLTYFGRTGYLATITSAGENAFVTTKLGGAGGWIGGSDLGSEGTWSWRTGPEAGTNFCIDPTPGTQGPGFTPNPAPGADCAPVGGAYVNWNTGEPNNNWGSSSEEYLQILAGGTGQWNDLPVVANATYIQGYVVEYGGLAGDTPMDISGSVTVNVTGDATWPTAPSSNPPNGAVLPLPGPAQITVTYSEDVNHVSAIDPASATNVENYLLAEAGPNKSFDTVNCAGGPLPDDVPIAINSIAYDPATFTATLSINGGVPLPVGSYRLFVCGTTSIEDPTGNVLNNGLADTRFDFTVAGSALPATGFAPGQITRLPVQPADKSYAATEMMLEIPALKQKLTIVGVPQSSNEGWDVTWLGRNAGWLQGTAFPTWAGNSVVTAHVWDAQNQPGPFSNLKNLKHGDQVRVHAWGQVYIFEVRENFRTRSDNLKKVLKHEELPWLTLLTCEDYQFLWNNYSGRRVVRAVLIAVK